MIKSKTLSPLAINPVDCTVLTERQAAETL